VQQQGEKMERTIGQEQIQKARQFIDSKLNMTVPAPPQEHSTFGIEVKTA
jgi:hypothetical protein